MAENNDEIDEKYIQHTPFDNVYEAIKYCEKDYAGNDYIFRGQNMHWALKSTIYRLPNNDERKKELIQTLKFVKWIKHNPVLKFFHEDFDSCMALAQHYGFKTDLIDFTYDPRIAGYFATAGQIDYSKNGVIYVVSISEWEEIYKIYRENELQDLDISKEAFYKPVLPTSALGGFWRLQNQQGLFVKDNEGFVSLGPYGLIYDTLFFKQHPNGAVSNYITTINNEFVWPPPNQFELEIEKFSYVSLTRHPLPEWIEQGIKLIQENIKNGNIEFVPFEPSSTGKKIEEELPLLDWKTDSNLWEHIDQTTFNKFPKFRSYPAVDFVFNNPSITFTETNSEHLHIVRLLRKNIEVDEVENPVIRLIIEDTLKDKDTIRHNTFLSGMQSKLEMLLNMMLMSPYSELQIAIAVQNLFAFSFCCQNGLSDETITKAFPSRKDFAVELQFEDKSGAISKSHVPGSYFERINTMTNIRNMVNERYNSFNLRSNVRLFQLIGDIRKLLSLDQAIQLWSSIVLPFQIAFQDRNRWIINPFYLVRMGYA